MDHVKGCPNSSNFRPRLCKGSTQCPAPCDVKVEVVVSSAEFDSNRLLHFRDWFVPQDHWIELQLEPLPFEGPAEKKSDRDTATGKCAFGTKLSTEGMSPKGEANGQSLPFLSVRWSRLLYQSVTASELA